MKENTNSATLDKNENINQNKNLFLESLLSDDDV
jgi:hypothetical protein